MTEITLTFNRKDFEELYFRNGHEKIFFSPTAKSQTYLTMVIGLFCFTSAIYTAFTNNYWGLFFLLFIVFCLVAFELARKIRHIYKWRRSVKEFLDRNEKYKKNKIILSENAFVLVQDSKETIERWSEFKKAEIDEIAITLSGSVSYLIPRKSMTNEEYELLKKTIGDRIKNRSEFSIQ